MERQRFGVALLPLRRARGALSEATPAELEVVYALTRLGLGEVDPPTEVRWTVGGSTVRGWRVGTTRPDLEGVPAAA